MQRVGLTTRLGQARAFLVALATLLLPLGGIMATAIIQTPLTPPLATPEPAPVVEDPAPVVAIAPEPPPPPPPPPLPAPTLQPTPQPAPQPAAQSEPKPFDLFPRWTREDRLNILLLGIDRRPDELLARTDTIMVASVDLRAHQAMLVSIPRDLVVTIPGHYQDRINSVYPLGEINRPGQGISLLRQTIERNFGVSVDHYALIDFNCFRGAVDAIGGVYVNVPERIHDSYYPTDDYGYKVVDFTPGTQWFDGERALEYARTRHADSDFGRMRRQQILLDSLRQQVLRVSSLSALPQVAQVCGGMSSDLSVVDLAALGYAARDFRPSDIAMRIIDEKMAIPYTAPSGADVLLPRWDQIRALFKPGQPATSVASAY